MYPFKKMKMRILAAISVFACLPCACSRPPEFAAPKSLKSRFPDQFARLEYYAQNFTTLIDSVPFPPKGAEERDKQLFHIPPILNLSLHNETTSLGLGLKSWSRQPLNGKSFWLPPDSDKLPRVIIGKGKIGGGKEIDIVEYTDVVVEPGTGNKIRITIDFDLAELKKQAEALAPNGP